MSCMKCRQCGDSVPREKLRRRICPACLYLARARKAARIKQQLAGGKVACAVWAKVRAKNQGRIDGPYICAVCGMRGPGPKCAEGDCEDGVRRFGAVLESLNIEPVEYFENEELRDSVQLQVQNILDEGSQP